MEILTKIIIIIPFLGWVAFRTIVPRMIYKELRQGNYSDPKHAQNFLIIEGLLYLIPVYILVPFGKAVPAWQSISWFLCVFLSIWTLVHGLYFLKFKSDRKSD